MMEGSSSFKKCPMCSFGWNSRSEFLTDENLELNGYQVDFENLYLGLFYFTHTIDGCHTTMALRVELFLDLLPDPQHKRLDTDGKNCPGYCHDLGDLRHCNNECRGAYIRDIMSILKDRTALVSYA
jgi:hypothetical protein